MAVGSALAGRIAAAAAGGAGCPAPGHAHEDTYQSGGLALTVNLPTRTPAAHDEERLHVEVSLRNPGGTAKPYRLDDFHLVSGAGGRWTPNRGSFAPGMLAPGCALNLDPYFDYPLGHNDLSVSWTPVGGDPVFHPAHRRRRTGHARP